MHKYAIRVNGKRVGGAHTLADARAWATTELTIIAGQVVTCDVPYQLAESGDPIRWTLQTGGNFKADKWRGPRAVESLFRI